MACFSMNAGQDTNAPSLAAFTAKPRQGTRDAGFSAQCVDRFETSSSTLVWDKFGSTAGFDWVTKSEDDGYRVVSEWNTAGRSVVQNSFTDAAREMAVHSEFVEECEDSRGWKGWIAWLFIGTVGNTAEEHINITSPSVTASLIAWMRARREDESLLIAPHFLDTRPYLYQSSVWKKHSGEPILFEDFRVRYEPLRSMRVEEETVIPLTSSWQFAASMSIDPMRFDRPGSGSGASFSFSRIFSIDESLSIGSYVSDRSHASFHLAFSRSF